MESYAPSRKRCYVRFVHRPPGSDWSVCLVMSLDDDDADHGYYVTTGIVTAEIPTHSPVVWGFASGAEALAAALNYIEAMRELEVEDGVRAPSPCVG